MRAGPEDVPPDVPAEPAPDDVMPHLSPVSESDNYTDDDLQSIDDTQEVDPDVTAKKKRKFELMGGQRYYDSREDTLFGPQFQFATSA